MPRFSIILPCYNAQDTLVATLKSLLRQTDPDFELICIDDRSTDNTLGILRTVAKTDPRIRVMTPPKSGPSIARNLGAATATGELLCFCDADDLWEPNKLAEMRRIFAQQKADAVFARIMFFSQPGKVETTSTVPNAPLKIPTLLGENPVCTMSNLVVRKTCFLQYGGFKPELVHNEDLEWLIRCVASGGRVIGLNKSLVWYRSVASGLSANLKAMAHSRKQVLQTAINYGHTPTRTHEAKYLRYLARRALRLDQGRLLALRFTLLGLLQQPLGFLLPLHRGLGTAIGAAVSPFLPRSARQVLFSR